MEIDKLIEIIKVMKRDFIDGAIESRKADGRFKEEDKKYPTITNFNINNLSLLSRNICYMKKWYDDATPLENRHSRTLTYEYELLGGLILAGYDLHLYDPLSKEDNVAKRRLAFGRLRDRDMVTKLFNELGPRYKNRAGGYLRIMKCGFRSGDDAPMAYVELVDRPE